MMLLPRENRFNVNLNDKEKYYRSSKIQALVERLMVLGPDDKVVVFSQFLGMLDLIEHELKLEGLSYVVISVLFSAWKAVLPTRTGPRSWRSSRRTPPSGSSSYR
jgi:hypothetical protein